MDPRINECPDLDENDRSLLHDIEAGLRITADVSRADLLLCARLASDRAVVLHHAMPHSIPSTYRETASGRVFNAEEQPLLMRVLRTGRGGRRQLEILSSGAPVLQDIHPIYNVDNRVIGALIVETNMIADERQRRRNHSFRLAVLSLQDMCMRGDLRCVESAAHFGPYDGVYLVDAHLYIIYMSGIAANMFRSIGLAVDLQGQRVAELEAVDEQIVAEVLATGACGERSDEVDDGRVWQRTALPLKMTAAPFRFLRMLLPRWFIYADRHKSTIDAVLVLVHNATEAVQKQRELNVKSAIIQEVHHRVKNNLQTIAAMLRIQARRCESEEARHQLNDAVNRILSMSVIHEFLSQDEHRPINIRDVCQRIAQQIQQVAASPDQEIEVQINGPNIRLPASQATPTAMVINELMLNAVEHGLSGHSKGLISVALEDLGDSVQVVLQNSGRGLPPNFDLQQSRNLGLQIVHTLVTDDLKGDLRLETVTANSVHEDPDLVAENAGVAEADTRTDADGEVFVNGAAVGTRAIITFPKRSLKVD